VLAAVTGAGGAAAGTTLISMRRARRRWETQAVDKIAAAKTPISGGRVAPVRVVELNRVQFETRRFQAKSSPSEWLWKAGTTGF
jgi:hypothetical protein